MHATSFSASEASPPLVGAILMMMVQLPSKPLKQPSRQLVCFTQPQIIKKILS